MSNKQYDIGVAKQIGKYSDAVEVATNARWLYGSGTPGLLANKELPQGIEAQARVA